MKIGLGYDMHALVKGRKLVLGGVLIPFDKGLEGWSDGDCLTHSVIDALFGAAGLGDIGKHFGTDKPENKNISSIILLNKAVKIVKKYKVNNTDSTIICERPKLFPFIDRMRENISKTLNIHKNRVNIKSTTAKKIGELGHSKAIACFTIISLK